MLQHNNYTFKYVQLLIQASSQIYNNLHQIMMEY